MIRGAWPGSFDPASPTARRGKSSEPIAAIGAGGPKIRAIGFMRGGEVAELDERRQEIESVCVERGFKLVRVVGEKHRGSADLPIVVSHRQELLEAIDAIAAKEATVLVAAGVDLAGDEPGGLSKVIRRVEAARGRLLIDGHIML